MTFPKGRGGVKFNPQFWNQALQNIEDIINFLEDKNFSAARPLAITKFSSTPLQRINVSSNGGASKALEHNNSSDISMNLVPPRNFQRVFTSDSDTFLETNFLNDRQEFVVNGTTVARIDSTGWTDLIP